MYQHRSSFLAAITKASAVIVMSASAAMALDTIHRADRLESHRGPSGNVLRPGDYVVAESYPLGGGALTRVDPESSEQSTIADGRWFTDAVTTPDGRLLALSSRGIEEFDLATGTSRLISDLGLSGGIDAVSDGRIFVAEPFGYQCAGGGGDVLLVDPNNGIFQPIFCLHCHPSDVAYEPTDSVLIASRCGLIRCDPVTGADSSGYRGYRIFVPSSSEFLPTAITLSPNGIIYAVSLTQGGGSQVLRIDPVTGDRQLISQDGLLAHPRGITLSVDGSILIADAKALPDDSGSQGALIRIDATTGVQTAISSGGILQGPRGIAIVGTRNGQTPVTQTSWGRIKAERR